MAGANQARPFRHYVLASLLVLAAAALTALWLGFGQTEDDSPRAAGTVVVTAPTAAPPAATLPSGTMPATPALSGDKPSPGMKHALALADGAIVRDVQVFSRQLGISCGEVSPSGDSSTFKRFFYISIMKTGRVDDGTEEFRSHAANVCVARS